MKTEHDSSIFRDTSEEYAAKRVQTERNIKKSVFVLFSGMLTAVTIYSLRGYASDQLACEFVHNKYLLYLWPPNGSLINSLDATNYTLREKCEFIALRSLMSAALIPYLIYVLVSHVASSDSYYRKGEMTPFVIVLALGIYAAFDPISAASSRYKLSAVSSIEVNLIKSGVSIYGTYLCLFILSSRLFSCIRSAFSLKHY